MTRDIGVVAAEARKLLSQAREGGRALPVRRDAARELEALATEAELGALAQAAQALGRALDVGRTAEAMALGTRVALVIEAIEVCHGPSLLDLDPEDAAAVREVFLIEAEDHLEAIARAIARLRAEPASREGFEELFRKVHTLKSAGGAGFDAVGHAAHKLEDALDRMRAKRQAATPAVLDGLLGIADVLRTLVEGDASGQVGRLAEALARIETTAQVIERGTVPPHLDEPLTGKRPSGPPLPERIELTPALAPERRHRDSNGPGRRRDDVQMLKIDPDRVDELLDVVGEIVIDRTRIERRVFELRGLIRDVAGSRGTLRTTLQVYRRTNPRDPEVVAQAAEQLVAATTQLREVEAELSEALSNFERLGALLADDAESVRKASSRLQERLQRMRMAPVGALFSRVAHMAREAARVEGKLVEVVTEGDQTELDRTLGERLGDSLVQLVRNAVAHGIEAPDLRERSGKPRVGLITMVARQEGELFFVDVSDDGAGIDTELVRRTLVRSGRVTFEAAVAMTEEKLFTALFEPGFSTREDAGAVAGRGVGLDVVRDSIARMGGSITVASRRGDGTRFSVRLPLVTTISQALLFKVGGNVYAIPSVHVLESIELPPEALGRECAPSLGRLRDATLPMLWLDRVLGAPPRPSALQQVLVLLYGDQRFLASCDKVIGPREIVVKLLPALLTGHPLFVGATISGAGKVQLVLDVATLAAQARGSLAPPSVLAAQNRPRILLADDSRTVRESVGRILTAGGYAVEVAADGAEAWELLGERPFDLLVTDLEMPRMTGLELCRRLKGEPRLRELPVVVISSRSGQMHRDGASEAGAFDMLRKPILRRSLLDCVGRALGRGG